MRLSRSILFCAVVVSTLSLAAQRLPSNVHPEHYALHFTPDLKAATFTGEETIDLSLDQPVSAITLNAVELKISSVKAVVAGKEQATGHVSYDEGKQQATLEFGSALPAGKVSLAIEFTGILNDKLRGFYLSKTKKRSYAVTQFESTDARRAFPCFDEPAMKATFDVSLTVDKGDTVIANEPTVKDSQSADGLKHTMTFATTPKMSTYLVAFQVGDFECTKGKSDGIPIRACATPDNVRLTKFAVKAAEHFLHYYNSYFGIPYPMQKLDMIGIPDFEAGAMENFGCITYRETDLLVDEKKASHAATERVAVVVAHEMAHQWFGDMVTMQWWDNVWLNEGFADWMESKAVGEWKPEWQMRDEEAASLNGTMNLDAQSTTHAIRAKADSPEEIEEMFDGISYGKGGAVVGMVEHYLGEEIFRQGVHNYLKAHLYANATAEDFWNAQTQTSGKPVDRIMSGFVEQKGVPMLRFSEVAEGHVKVTQSRFNVANASGETWTIPVCFKGGTCQLISPDANTVAVPNSTGFAYGNADFKGYYRSAYARKDLSMLLAGASALSSPERIGLIGDRWALVRSNDAKISEYLDLVHALHGDTNASVLEAALDNVGYLRSRLATVEEKQKLDAWIRTEFGPVYQSIRTAKGKSEDLKERKSTLFRLLGSAKDPAVLADAKKSSDRYFHQNGNANPEGAISAIQIAAADGTQAEYEKILQWSRTTEDPRNRITALTTLSDFEDAALVERTLQMAVSGEVRNQDNWRLIAGLLARPATREITWNFIQKNWGKVQASLTVSSGQRIVSATGVFCSDEKADEVKQFFASHPVKASERTLRSALNSIHTCATLRAQQAPSLDSWLTENVH